MSISYTYLFVDLCCLAVPFLSSFHPKIQFYKSWNSLLLATAIMMLIFIPLDMLYTYWGIWGFNPQYTVKHPIINLPLEEFLFFICIPYASLFTYFCLKKFQPVLKHPHFWKRVAWVYCILNLIVALIFYHRAYTFLYHLFSAMLLAWCLVREKVLWMSRFMLTYTLILIPFIISNGVLTGLQFWRYPLLHSQPDMIQSCIVWYNNTENLGVRLFSIPLDDIAYGSAMLLTVVFIFEKLEEKKQAVHA